MLTILRVKGASCQDIDDLGEGTLHSLCLDWLLVDLHIPRGDSGRCNEHGGYNHMRSHVISFRLSLVLLLSCFVLLTACGQSSSTTTGAKPTSTPTVALDFYGTPIAFPTTAPQRIVSLLPSTSEILGALHLQGRVVAVDYYTSYPPELASLPKVSDVNGKYNVEQIVALKPDLILSWGGETKQYDQQLESLGLRVVDLPITNFSGVLQQILLVGHLTSTPATAQSLVHQLQHPINGITPAVAGPTATRVLLE